MNSELGKGLIGLGFVIILVGMVILFRDKFPWLQNFGNLPGDIAIKNENTQFYFPLTTSILASILLSFCFWLYGKFFS